MQYSILLMCQKCQQFEIVSKISENIENIYDEGQLFYSLKNNRSSG